MSPFIDLSNCTRIAARNSEPEPIQNQSGRTVQSLSTRFSTRSAVRSRDITLAILLRLLVLRHLRFQFLGLHVISLLVSLFRKRSIRSEETKIKVKWISWSLPLVINWWEKEAIFPLRIENSFWSITLTIQISVTLSSMEFIVQQQKPTLIALQFKKQQTNFETYFYVFQTLWHFRQSSNTLIEGHTFVPRKHRKRLGLKTFRDYGFPN